jgi:drug/metabolite transporter (DMT)-like permease
VSSAGGSSAPVVVLPAAPLPTLPLPAAAALAAALCWTLASLLWRRLPTSLSAVQLNLLKNLLAVALQLPMALSQAWLLPPRGLLLLAASGVVGIALGDSLFFAALRRLGTRRALTIDAGGPAFTTLAGAVLLGESPGPAQLAGLALITLAVVLVARGAAQPPPKSNGPSDGSGAAEAFGSIGAAGLPLAGVLLALGALVCGSFGALLSRAALLSGPISPLQAATLRLAAAGLVLLPLAGRLPLRVPRPRPALRRWPLLLLATLLGTSAGIVLQQAALAGLSGGRAVALMSTAPVMALPLAWWLEGDRPGWRGLAAAGAALAGVSLVVGPPGSL